MIAIDHAALNLYCAPSGIQHASKFNEKTIAHHLEDPSTKAKDCRIEELPAMLLQSQQRAFFIGFHQSAVANDIGGENRRKATLNVRILQRVVPACCTSFPACNLHPSPSAPLTRRHSRTN